MKYHMTTEQSAWHAMYRIGSKLLGATIVVTVVARLARSDNGWPRL